MTSSPVLRVRASLSKLKARVVTTLARAKWRLLARSVTAEALERDLRRGGIRSGDLLFVHAAFSRVGDVQGGAGALCDVLMKIVGRDGTVVMPTFHQPRPILEMLAQGVCVDLRSAASATGKLSETFRKRPGTLRSSHPYSSCSAAGRLAAAITDGHEQSAYLCGPGSPLARLIDYDGRILGIGVDLGPVSFYHVVEDTLPEFPVRTRLPSPFRASYVDATGKTVERDLYVLDPSVSRTRIERNEWIRGWFTEHLRREGILREFRVGQANCWTMEARRLYDELVQLARKGITIYTTADTFPSPPSQ